MNLPEALVTGLLKELHDSHKHSIQTAQSLGDPRIIVFLFISDKCTAVQSQAAPCIYSCTYLAVIVFLGVMTACSIVLGLPLCVPGRTNPVTGRPDWERGLYGGAAREGGEKITDPHSRISSSTHLTPWLIPWLVVPVGLLRDVPGPSRKRG